MKITLLYFFSFTLFYSSFSQCGINTPTFVVDLRIPTNMTWISPDTARNDTCCGSHQPEKCMKFIVSLPSRATGIVFEIYSGAIPQGAMYYQVGCSSPTSVGDSLCLSGAGPHIITFCKPGGNKNRYTIRAFPDPTISANMVLNEGCTGKLKVTNYYTPSITWNSIYPGALGTYNSYLSCSSACDSTIVTGQAGYPPYVDFRVCGILIGMCGNISICDTARVYFNSTLRARIQPDSPSICFGALNTILTANGIGGSPTYHYSWSTGDTTRILYADTGTYILTVYDTSQCPPAYDTVRVTAFSSSINANAGIDLLSCDTFVNLSGQVTAASGGRWYLGSGTFSPSRDSLLTKYYPTLAELTAGNVTFLLITTGNRSCPADTDTINVRFRKYSDTLSSAVYNVSCFGKNDGAIVLTLTGHAIPFSYLWSNAATTNQIININSGIYNVTVTDSLGCIWTNTFTITEPDLLQASSTATNVNCMNGSNGTINLTVSGGTAPYRYLWNTGQTSEDLGGLVADTFMVIVRDTNNCLTGDTIIITEPTVLQSNGTITNVRCKSENNGSVSFNVTGGIAGYEYIWSNGDTIQSPINLVAGTYIVQVNDTLNCILNDTFTITEPDLLQASSTSTNVSCKNGSNGTINLSVTGGTIPYRYLWNSSQTTEDLGGLVADTFMVIVRDTNNCQTADTIILTEPTALQGSGTITNVRCKSENNGSISFNVTGGIAGYKYIWSNGDTIQSPVNLVAGTYIVQINDTLNCFLNDTFTITEPDLLQASSTSTNVSCKTGSNGSINLTVIGGTTPYRYLWNTSQTSEDLGSLAADTFMVIVRDTNNCQTGDTIIITEPTALQSSGTITNVRCKSENNGSISFNVTGGTAGYEYDWSNNDSIQSPGNLVAGTYIVQVNDTLNCFLNDTFTITEPDLLQASFTSMNVSCKNGSNGAINLTVIGGTTPYRYLWNTSQTTEDLGSLAADTFIVIVRDTNNCLTGDTIIITEPTALQSSGTITNVRCKSDNNGSISFNVTGGTAGYKYIWSNGDTIQSPINLVAGTYIVQVNDTLNCILNDTFTITEPDLLQTSSTSTNVSCKNGSNGSINLTITGGTTPYRYLWNTSQTSEDLGSLAADIFIVVVRDTNNCLTGDTIIITEPTALQSSGTITNVRCKSENNGSISFNVTGGTAGYEYAWSNGDKIQSPGNLVAGMYIVQVNDTKNCILNDTFTITEPDFLQASSALTNVSCKNGSNGAINLTVIGGTNPYRYLWNTSQTSEDLGGLVADTFMVIVRDTNNCLTGDTIIITEPTDLQSSGTITNVRCKSDNNGSISFNVTGGTAGYKYAWSNGDTIQSPGNLVAGTYIVQINDTLNCMLNDTFTITEPDFLQVSSTSTNVSCKNVSNGTINLTVTGGTTPYRYLWNTSQTTEDLGSLAADTFIVVVRDTNNCLTGDTIIITEPTDLQSSGTITNVRCKSDNNGSISFNVTGGIAGYEYAWSNNDSIQSPINLVAGTYIVQVNDTLNCILNDTFTITEPDLLQASSTSTNVSCKNGLNGAIDLTVSGGTTPYRYLWNTTQTTEDVSGLAADTFMVIVWDTNNCLTGDTIIITEPTALQSSGTVNNVSCKSGNNGFISFNVTRGTPGYKFSWSNGDTLQSTVNLVAGLYIVRVTDAMNCLLKDTFTINEPDALQISSTPTNVGCKNGSNGSINLTVFGGTAPFRYLWSTGQTTEYISGLVADTFKVTVRDTNNCQTGDTIIITEPPALQRCGIVNHVCCKSGNNGSISVNINGGTPSYHYKWSTGDSCCSILNLSAGIYIVSVIDSDKCTAIDTFTITEPPDIKLSAKIKNVCKNGKDGEIAIIVTGGVPPYSYLWSNGSTTEDIQNLAKGKYYLTVRDFKGCTKIDSFDVKESIIPGNFSFIIEQVKCFGQSNGQVQTIVSGGTPPFLFKWSNGDTLQNIIGLPKGIYQLNIKDGLGCTDSDTIIINEPQQLSFTFTIKNLSCYNLIDGSILLNVLGGTKPYMCNWSSGDTGLSLINKPQGNYSAIIIDSNGCKTNLNDIITQPPDLILSYNIKKVNCFGGNDGTIFTTVSGGSPSFHYLWSTGDTTNNLNNLNAGTYYIIITEGNGCKTIDTVIVKEPLQLKLQYTSQNAGCNGVNNGAIDISVSGGTIPYSYLWSNNHSTEDIANLYSGQYRVTVTDFNNCKISSPLVTLLSFPLPQPYILPDSVVTVCKFDTVKMSVVEDYSSYFWNNGDTTKSISTIGTGSYFAQVIDSNGCKGKTNSVQISRIDPSIWLDLKEKYTYCPEDGPFVLSPGTRVNGFYLWQPTGDTTSEIIVTNEGTYIVFLNISGCEASDSTEIFQVCPPLVYVPNAITPNGDGLNDVFKISALYVDTLYYIVFDRWGTIIFRGYNETETWDATVNNNLVQLDAYAYIVWYSSKVYGHFMKKGTITVLY